MIGEAKAVKKLVEKARTKEHEVQTESLKTASFQMPFESNFSIQKILTVDSEDDHRQLEKKFLMSSF